MLKEFTLSYKPAILFIMETKVHGVRVEALRVLFQFANCFAVDSFGIGGGLFVMWSDEIQLRIFD